MSLLSRSQVALGNVAAKRPSLIIIFRERDYARPIRVPSRTGLRRVAGVEAIAGAFLFVLIPEITALPDAMAQAGEGADGGGVVSQHILRVMAGSARPTFLSTGEKPVRPVGSGRATHRVAPTQIVSSLFRKPGPQVPTPLSPYAVVGKGV